MKILALACDFDETIAPRGRIATELLPEFDRARALGQKLILVTGRELDDIRRVCPELNRFDLVVAENGAVLFDPVTEKVELLADAPSPNLLEALKEREIPFSVGRVIVSTRQPHETRVLEAIKDLGLELHLIFNKGAVMVLPAGVSKAFGLKAALRRLEISRHNVAAIGDAENDHSLLECSAYGVAVANSVESLKAKADLVTGSPSSMGVLELIAMICNPKASIHTASFDRHRIRLSSKVPEAGFDPARGSILMLSKKGRERDAITYAVTQAISKAGYQLCLLNFSDGMPRVSSIGTTSVGSATAAATSADLIAALVDPSRSVVVTVSRDSTPAVKTETEAIFKNLVEFCHLRGRPHFIIINEPEQALAHGINLGSLFEISHSTFVYITASPSQHDRPTTPRFNTVLATGTNGIDTYRQWCIDNEGGVDSFPDIPADPFTTLIWTSGRSEPYVVQIDEPTEQISTVKPSMDAPLEASRQFCFRGPQGAMSLTASTIRQFLEMGAGIDEDTWKYHFNKRDYSNWISRQLGLPDLASAVEKIEKNAAFTPSEARVSMDKLLSAYLG